MVKRCALWDRDCTCKVRWKLVPHWSKSGSPSGPQNWGSNVKWFPSKRRLHNQGPAHLSHIPHCEVCNYNCWERERERERENGLQSCEWVGNQIHLQCSRRPLGHKIVWCFVREQTLLKLFSHSDHLVALHTRPTLVVYTLFKISSEVEVSLDSGVSHFPLLFCRVFCGLSSKVDWHL